MAKTFGQLPSDILERSDLGTWQVNLHVLNIGREEENKQTAKQKRR